MLLYLGTSLKNEAQIAKLVKPKIVVSGYIHSTESRKFAEILNMEIPDIQIRAIRPGEIYYYPEEVPNAF
jgi:hypothetical protein